MSVLPKYYEKEFISTNNKEIVLFHCVFSKFKKENKIHNNFKRKHVFFSKLKAFTAIVVVSSLPPFQSSENKGLNRKGQLTKYPFVKLISKMDING